jgi:uncharacterized protein YdaU (DUF1376 family)
MHYFNFNIGDYASHTRHLSLLEDLAYRRLIDAYYLSEKPFIGSASDIAKDIGMTSQIEEVFYVLSKYFEQDETGWFNKRCDEEIAKYHEKQEQAVRAGKASAKARLSKRSTPVQPTNKQEPITNNQYTSEFESFWKVYDKPSGKANAFKIWKSIKPDTPLVETILLKANLQAKNVERKFRKDAERWLRDKRWEDEISDVQQVEKVKFI